MATKKISELEAITSAEDSDVLVVVDVSEGTTNKITKGNLLIGSGHSITMEVDSDYKLTLKLKNAVGTELSTASIDLPNEDAITGITYSEGVLTLTKQSGSTSQVDISGLIEGLVTESNFNTFVTAIKGVIGISTNTYDSTQTYNTGDIVIQSEKIYKANQDNITGTFDNTKWDEISLYEYQKIQDEAIQENYKVITKLQQKIQRYRNQLPQVADEGYDVTLNDTIEDDFVQFDIEGHSEQNVTNNLLNLTTVGPSGTRYNEKAPTLTNGIINVKGKNDETLNVKGKYQNGYIEIHTTSPWKPNTNYYISCKIQIVSNIKEMDTSYFSVALYGGAFGNITYNSTTGRYEGYITSPETISDTDTVKTLLEFRVDGMELNVSEISLKTTQDYTFNGYGISPSPEVPSEIHSTGDNVNLFDLKGFLTDRGVAYTENEDGSLTFTLSQVLYSNSLQFSNENITVSLSGNVTNGTATNTRLEVLKDDGSIAGEINASRVKVENISGSKIRFNWSTAGTVTMKNIKLEQDTKATPYSPYGCGNVNEKIENIKNFLDWNKFIDYSNWEASNSPSYKSFKIDGLKANTKYTLCRINNDGYNISPAMYAGFNPVNNNTNRFVDYATQGSNLKAITAITNNNSILYVVFAMSDATRLQQYINLIQDCWVIEGDSFIEKQEQNISFPLAQGQKLMEGDYLADDGVHHKMGEVVFDGTENWMNYSSTYDGRFYCTTKHFGQSSGYLVISKFKCTHFTPATNTSISNGILSTIYATYIKADIEGVTSPETFKTWLSNNNVTVQYELAEEVIDPYTQEQQAVWEQIKALRTYKPVTHISSTDEVKPYIKASGLKDLNKAFEDVTNAIISLGGNI